MAEAKPQPHTMTATDIAHLTGADNGPRVTTINTDYLANIEAELNKQVEVQPVKKKQTKITKAQRKARKLEEQIEFQKLEIRDHLRRELELSRESAKKGRENWEDMCKEIKIVELREELQTWNVKAQRLFEQKDEKIVALLEDIDSTLEMHKRNFAKQIQIMDHILVIYKTLVDCSKSLYESQAVEIIQDFHEELNAKQQTEDGIYTNCENIMHATNLVAEQQILNDYQIYQATRNDRVNTEIEKRYRIRDSIIAKMKTLQKQLIEFVHILHRSTLEVNKYERIRQLMDKQRNFVTESQKLNDVEFHSARLLSELQRDLVHMEVESQRNINDLRLEYAYFVQVRKSIENNMKVDREITFEKLKILTSENYKVIEQYKKLEKYGELLLSLAASCRKLETQSEKVWSWGDFQEPKNPKTDEKMEEYFKIEILNLRAHVDLTEEELVNQMKVMKNFWRRQSLVEMQIVLLNEEKRHLMQENEKYVNFIKSMSISEDVNDLLKTITVVNLVPENPPCPVNKKHKLVQKRK